MSESPKALPCIICGRELDQILSGSFNHPSDGCVCRSWGNYGSTVFDPMDGTFLEFNICDPCMNACRQSVRVVRQHTNWKEEVKEFKERECIDPD